jgi:hypothetical protein
MKIKNVIKGMLLMTAIVIGSSSVFAKGRIIVSPYLKTSYAIIAVESAEKSMFYVTITNSNGDVVYSRNRIKNGEIFTKLFDFSSLEDGEYKISLRRKGVSTIEEVFIVKDGLLVPKELTKDVASADFKIMKKHTAYGKSKTSGLAFTGNTNVSIAEGSFLLSFASGNKVVGYEFR